MTLEASIKQIHDMVAQLIHLVGGTNQRMIDLSQKMEEHFSRVDKRLTAVEEQVSSMDKRLCGIEHELHRVHVLEKRQDISAGRMEALEAQLQLLREQQ